MAKYTLKYFFDWCSGSPLWDNKGIVSLEKLPLSSELKQFLYDLSKEYDKALNWDEPLAPLLWSDEEKENFYQKAHEGHRRLQEELGDDYDIIYSEEE
ncbi:hypothetical protein [Ruminococcus flavefaciens]|uniref:hypothetical protein n=1 Tax=Ruminococcus flavefaciens TaxID=1265 RepID=UPI000491E696|nr:hypothetical protein [Ruminococcus flavefaciens]